MKFKRFAIGIAIFILTILFIVFVNAAINKKPSETSCYQMYETPYLNEMSPLGGVKTKNYNYSTDFSYDTCLKKNEQAREDHRERSFLIITSLSVLAIIAGVLVRSVAPVSWGLVMAGLVMVLYIFIDNYEAIDKPYRAIMSGIALAALIWIAYAKLGDEELINGSSEPVAATYVKPPQNGVS